MELNLDLNIAAKKIWKPNLYRLGILLTLMVMAADWGQWLNVAENQLGDLRARRCQLFTPTPTDRIVHIDIDDQSLDEIGSWPWPRSKLAKLIDEISLAKPKVIGMDMYFSEPSGSESTLPEDDIFAESLRRAGNVLLPISVAFEKDEAPDQLLLAVKRVLRADLELDSGDIVEKLKEKGNNSANLAQSVRSILGRARQEAMLERINEEVAIGTTDYAVLRAKLIPKSEASRTKSDATKFFNAGYPKAMAITAMKRFRIPLPDGVPLASAPTETAVNIQKFSEAIRYSGFVDLPDSGDGTVRSIPLMVNYRGSGFPHMALGIACALLDIKPSDVRYGKDSIVLPVAGRDPINIPARVEQSSKLGKVGAMTDVPYWGKRDDGWLYMYDFPRYERPIAHIPMRVFWTFIKRGDSMRTNNATADKVIKEMADTFQAEAAVAYLKNVPDLSDTETRLKVLEATEKELTQFFAELLAKKESELASDEKELLAPFKSMQRLAKENRESYALLKKDRVEFQAQLQNKAVIIGSTGTGAYDFYPTSLHPKCPGAVIQGVVINAILRNNLWRRAPHWVTAMITLIIGGLTTIVVAILPGKRAFACAMGIALAYAILNGYVLFDYGNIVVGSAGPLIACALVWSVVTLTNFVTEARERSRIRKSFSSYVDPQLVEYVEAHPELATLAGQRREMSVVFTDLAGFTTISEKLGESTVPLLNSYFGKMVPVVRENRGYVNKFLGDGLMFFYGAPRENPNHATDAVQTVIQMRKALDAFNVALAKQDLPPVGMRAGMTSGMMVVGDAGSRSEDARHTAADYTVLGDRVNLAARLESANKFFGSNLLMNSRTRELIGDDKFLVRPIGKIVVKGKSEDVMTYEAICNLNEATDAQILHVALSKKVVEAFQAGEFDDCILLCDELQEKTGDEEFADTYRMLCRKHLTTAFEGIFNGQIVLSEK